MVDSVLASWADAIDHTHEDAVADMNSSVALADSDVSSEKASSDSCSDPEASFLADADFAVAVARAAELSGMTVVGSTVHDPNAAAQLREKGEFSESYDTHASHASRKVLDFFLKIPGPGKAWKITLVLQSRGKYP